MAIHISRLIHDSIMEFDPSNFESYQRCALALKSLEAKIDDTITLPLKTSLLARVRTQLISMAHEMDNLEEVDQWFKGNDKELLLLRLADTIREETQERTWRALRDEP